VVELAGGAYVGIRSFDEICLGRLLIEFTVIVFVVNSPTVFLRSLQSKSSPDLPGMVPGGFEFELLLGLCCLAFLFGGARKMSLDHAVGKEL